MENINAQTDYQTRTEFEQICLACRTGDIRTVSKLVSSGSKVNQVDEWDNSPLILASLCGHKDVVLYLLDHGAICDQSTYEGERCVYGALNDEIRNILVSYDMSKSMEVSNPLMLHLVYLYNSANDPHLNDKLVSSDVVIRFDAAGNSLLNGWASGKSEDVDDSYRYLRLHKFILSARSGFFRKRFANSWQEKQVIDAALIYQESEWLQRQSTLRYEDLQKAFTFVMENVYLKLDIRGGFTKLNKKVILEILNLLEIDKGISEFVTLDFDIKMDNRKKTKKRNALSKQIVQKGMHDLQTYYTSAISGKRSYFEKQINKAVVDNEEPGESEADNLAVYGTLGSAQYITDTDKRNLIIQNYSYWPDIIVSFKSFDEKKMLFYPFHKAMLLSSEYYRVLFESGFAESIGVESFVDSVFKTTTYESLITNPHLIPVIDVSVNCSEAFDFFAEYLYYDQQSMPVEVAIEMLSLGDYLQFPKLKSLASFTIINSEKLCHLPEHAYLLEIEALYNILKAAWEFDEERLKQYAARMFASNLTKYIDSPLFGDLVVESAAEIKNREETDTIELIDEIRYYLRQKYIKDKYDSDKEQSDDYIKLEADEKLIEDLLTRLDLEGWWFLHGYRIFLIFF